MAFQKLQAILWQGNELSFPSKEHPPSVLCLSPGAPTGRHPRRNVKFSLILERWMSFPWGPGTSSHLRCPLVAVCLYAFAADDCMLINEAKKNGVMWTVPLFWDLKSWRASVTRRQSSCNAFFNTCIEQPGSRSFLKQCGNSLLLLSARCLIAF